MTGKSVLIKSLIIILFISILFSNSYVFAEENLEEQFKLLEEAKKEGEKNFLKTLTPYRGKEYKYARVYATLQEDENGDKFFYFGGGGAASWEYNNYFKMKDTINNAINENLKEYLSTNNENEKLKGYFIMNCTSYTRENEYKEQSELEGKIILFFVPEIKSSKWCEHAEKAYTQIYNERVKDYIRIDGYYTEIYIRLVWENDRYVIKFLDNKPEGYDEFVARMKENGIDVENIDYAKLINANADIKQEIQAAEQKEYESKQVEVGNIRKGIIISCGSFIFVILFVNLIIDRRKKKKI